MTRTGLKFIFTITTDKPSKKQSAITVNVQIINKNNNSCFKVPGRKDLENLTPPSWKLPPLGPPSHLYF